MHIPSSAKEPVKDAQLRQLSQVTELTVGNLKVAEDGSYLIDNYPLYADSDNNHYIKNENGKKRWCVDVRFVKEKIKSNIK